MRNKTFISSMVGIAAAVAVAGSANAGVVDPFTTAATFGNASATWTPITGGLFAERQAQKFNGVATGSPTLGFGSWTASFLSSPASAGITTLNYRVNGSGGTIDLSGIASMSFALSGVSGSMNLNWYFQDVTGLEATQAAVQVPVTGSGTQTFDFSTAVLQEPEFDWTQITGMTVSMTRSGSIAAGFTVSSFNSTAVPAPGALALLGAAGLVGARRRRA